MSSSCAFAAASGVPGGKGAGIVGKAISRAGKEVAEGASKLAKNISNARRNGKGAAAVPGEAKGAANSTRSAITGSRVVSGRFPRTAGANDILVRRGSDGGVTNYQVYGPDGLPLKRVDVTGRSHGGVDTPHVVEFERHVNPTTGEVFVRPGSTVRPATPEELIGLD